jgi:hypothetical protein
MKLAFEAFNDFRAIFDAIFDLSLIAKLLTDCLGNKRTNLVICAIRSKSVTGNPADIPA